MRKGGGVLICLLLLFATGCVKDTRPFGVFIGADPENIGVMDGYQTVVIDAAYYSQEEISGLRGDAYIGARTDARGDLSDDGRTDERAYLSDDSRADGKTIYSYLNAGSLETFRPYYDRFEQYTLDGYYGWPGEYWMDITQPDWQDFVVDELAAALCEKGVDGFFIDNFDVYYNYPDEVVYTSAINILDRLKKQYGLYIIINGADTFVERLIEGDHFSLIDSDDHLSLIDAVNQECVFTAIDFDGNTLNAQQPEDTQYYMEYLDRCAAAGLRVFLTEYTKSASLSKKIKDYCEQNGFDYYISPNIELNG